MLSKEGLIRKTISDINSDFVERNFAGVIKSIALQIVPSGNRIMQHFVTIKEFCDRNQPGGPGMFSLFGQEDFVERNRQAVMWRTTTIADGWRNWQTWVPMERISW